jgi:hypothetical protein
LYCFINQFFNQNIRDTLKRWLQIETFITFSKVKFFTVRFEDEEVSETDKFFNTFANNALHIEELNKMVAFIENLGENLGADQDFFRHERLAQALPPDRKSMHRYHLLEFLKTDRYDFRLYCLRLSNSVVILFNGGLKTANNPENCPNVAPHFRNAQIFCRQIEEKLKDRNFLIVDKNLISSDELAFEY